MEKFISQQPQTSCQKDKPEVWGCCEINFSTIVDFELVWTLDFEESHLYCYSKK